MFAEFNRLEIGWMMLFDDGWWAYCNDEKPLGPREEGDDPTGENTFFDQDADRGTFRDVFRRRR